MTEETTNQNLIAYCIEGDHDNVELLLRGGLNPDCIGLIGITPLIAALSNKHFTIANLLLTYGATVDYNNDNEAFGQSALSVMCHQNNLEAVEYLLVRGANVNMASKLYGTPLKSAVVKGHLDIVNRLLDAGADIEMKSKSFFYIQPTDTPLCHAVIHNQMEVVMLLISKGAKTKILKRIPRNTIPTDMVKFLKSKNYL